MKNKNFLKHYGVIGMKWGIRKTRASSISKKTSSTSTGKKTAEEETTKNTSSKLSSKTSTRKQPVKKLSDKELRDAINRIEMEKRYNQIHASNVRKGKNVVGDIITSAAKQTASVYTAKYMAKKVEQILNAK